MAALLCCSTSRKRARGEMRCTWPDKTQWGACSSQDVLLAESSEEPSCGTELLPAGRPRDENENQASCSGSLPLSGGECGRPKWRQLVQELLSLCRRACNFRVRHGSVSIQSSCFTPPPTTFFTKIDVPGEKKRGSLDVRGDVGTVVPFSLASILFGGNCTRPVSTWSNSSRLTTYALHAHLTVIGESANAVPEQGRRQSAEVC